MFVEEVINNLYSILTIDPTQHSNISLIRLHTKKLQTLGEFSFPLDITNFKHVLPANWSENASINTIIEYIANKNKEFCVESICNDNVYFYKADIIKTNVHLFLHQLICFKEGIKDVMEQKNCYGSWKMNLVINLIIDGANDRSSDDLNISNLRMVKLNEVARNILSFNNCTIISEQADKNIVFSRNLNNNSDDILIHCAPVIITSTTINNYVPAASDYYKQRTIDMRLMAEHKYGVRISSQQSWKDFFEKLGSSAVMIELLENKPSHSLKLNLNNPTLSSQKNASFIMYNCARLAAIFKEFDKRILSKTYPKLPEFDEIELDLLKEPEEWELLFVYILQFPSVIKNTIKDIDKGKFNPHFITAFLSGLVSTFSIYYRRVKILCEPRLHLVAIMFARIYLLKAVQHVLHNALNLLSIEPISQM